MASDDMVHASNAFIISHLLNAPCMYSKSGLFRNELQNCR